MTAAVTAPASTAAAAATRIRPRGRLRLSGRLWASLILLVMAAGFVIPLRWVILAAVNGDPNQGVSIMWPHPFTLDNFKAVMTPETTYVPLLNGAILCIGGTLITMVCATLAAYPLVPKDEVGFRVQLTAANTDAEIDLLIAALEELAHRGELQPARAPGTPWLEAAA